jgi:hypothetical protein
VRASYGPQQQATRLVAEPVTDLTQGILYRIYTVRINNPGSSQQKYLSTSVRARCLLTANQERIRLHVDEEGAVIGVQYEVTPSECAPAPVDPAVEVQLPVEVPVTLEFPKPAPNVIFTGGEDAIGTVALATSRNSYIAPRTIHVVHVVGICSAGPHETHWPC